MHAPHRRATRAVAMAAGTAVALALVPSGAASAGPTTPLGCEAGTNDTVAALLECVTARGAGEHLEALQDIADDNGGNRAAGTPGYEASVNLVASTLRRAGWRVSIDEFPYTYVGPSALQQVGPATATYPTGPYIGSGHGDVTAAVTPVDLALDLPRASTSGCEAADFEGFPAGTIALLQRGSCDFAVKARNAQAAGASAVVLFNQGNTPDREALVTGTLGSPSGVTVPVVGGSFSDGLALSQAGSRARVVVPAPESRPQKNVLAELPGVNEGNVVMAGAHLDSVQAGPGINDNGSGAAALLEIAVTMAKVRPQNTVRLAWWGAEESGLVGSREYVAGLSAEERQRIALYLNVDMVASPNHVFLVYDGDESGSTGPVVLPEGSVAIEDLFESYLTLVGQPYDDAELNGRSDYLAFIRAGIPSGGLFTGAEVVKTPRQQALWGGVADEPFDPCYHRVCDTLDNLGTEAFDVTIDATALAVLAYAHSTEAVNGVPGVDVPGGLVLPAPAGPEGTRSAGGGGLDLDHRPSTRD